MSALPSPFTHPAAWQVEQLGSKDELAIELSSGQKDALIGALDATAKLAQDEITAQNFTLGGIEADLKDWVERVRQGTGLLLLRGMPVEDLSVEESERLFYGLGTHFGVAVSQSNQGEKVGRVLNIGGQDRRQRAYQNARQLMLHTDRCDYVGMLCLRRAMSGGLSGYASALTVHNKLLENAPELLAPLYEGFHLHRFGEQSDNSPLSRTPVPIFSVVDGWPNVVYIRGYIDLALDEGHYELTPLQQRALDTFDEIANEPAVRYDMMLESGEATITNNALLLHRRTSFEDHPEPERQRLLLRLWLMDPDLPTLPAVQAHKSLKGIEKVEGRGTYYKGPGYRKNRSGKGY